MSALLALWIATTPAARAEPDPVAIVATPHAAEGLDPAQIVGDPAGEKLAGPALDAATRRVASLLRCPTCQGMSVAESPAEGARAMKGEVQKLLAAGFSDQQVLDFFEASYGQFILLQPHASGANLALWWGPGALAAVGVLWVLSRLGSRTPPRPRAPTAQADPYLERVAREFDE